VHAQIHTQLFVYSLPYTYPTAIKFGTCLEILVKLQNINAMNVVVAVMQLLSEDVRTDRQTDMANWQYAI
jgi:hypothetical protein